MYMLYVVHVRSYHGIAMEGAACEPLNHPIVRRYCNTGMYLVLFFAVAILTPWSPSASRSLGPAPGASSSHSPRDGPPGRTRVLSYCAWSKLPRSHSRRQGLIDLCFRSRDRLWLGVRASICVHKASWISRAVSGVRCHPD